MLPVKTILHPTDFSEHSDYACRVARTIARDCGARLIVLHVDVPPVVYGEMGAAFILPEDTQARHATLKEQLHERYETDPETRVETRLKEGGVAEEIVRTAGEAGCDLIVLGTHGWGGLGRLLLGSVAEEVIRKARCPVLAVKLPTTEPARTPESRSPEAITA